MARYLVAASPLTGHVLPMMRIAADLSARGDDVTLLTGDEYRDAVVGCGVRPSPLPQAARPRPPRNARPARRLAPSLVNRWINGRLDLRSVFVAPMAAQYQALKEQLSTPVDAVLCDVAFTGAVPMLLTETTCPPVLVCGVGPLTLSSADTPPFGLGWRPSAGADYRQMTRFVHKVLFRDVQSAFDDALQRLGAPRSPLFLTDWPLLADRVLQLTVPALEFARSDLPRRVVFTGPVFPPAPVTRTALPSWFSGLRTAATVVHVTQGTWNNGEPRDLIRPTLEALGHRADLRIVVTTGQPGQTALAGPIPPNVFITDYLPYDELMPHVDVMITNGGYGGVHYALAHGVPLVIAGDSADKPDVAARVEATGAALVLNTQRVSPHAVAAAVDEILSTHRYHAAARALAADISACNALDAIADVLSGVQTHTAEKAGDDYGELRARHAERSRKSPVYQGN